MQPTMVVPVLVALGNGTPWACKARFRLWLEKSKPGMVADMDRGSWSAGGWRLREDQARDEDGGRDGRWAGGCSVDKVVSSSQCDGDGDGDGYGGGSSGG